MSYNPWIVVEETEKAFCEYLKADYCCLVDSCTSGIFLALKYLGYKYSEIIFPLKTYVSPPLMALATDNRVVFRDFEWSGVYEMEVVGEPHTRLYDSAKRLTSGCFKELANKHVGQSVVAFHSFHMKKHITTSSGKGGLIATNDKGLYDWCLRARWEGREPMTDYKDPEQDITIVGYNMNMSVECATFLYRQLQMLKGCQGESDEIKDLDEPGGYPELTRYTVFKDCKVIK